MSLNDILNMDDAVDQLTEDQVKDVFVRGSFMRQIYRANPRLLSDDSLDWTEQRLIDGSNSALKEVAIEWAGRDSDLSQALGWADGPGNVEILFARWTKDGIENVIEAARQNIKSSLRGVGMPDIAVQRERVKYLMETDTL